MTISKDRLIRRQTEFKFCECGCKESIPIFTHDGLPARFKHGHNSKGESNPAWNGGKAHGIYIRIWKPDYYRADKYGYLYEHIYVYEQSHKCCLLSWSNVHHIDGNKHNNIISNLSAMMRKAHDEIHGNLLKPKHRNKKHVNEHFKF